MAKEFMCRHRWEHRLKFQLHWCMVSEGKMFTDDADNGQWTTVNQAIT